MEPRHPRGLAFVIGGVGGLDLCGSSMRWLARTGRLPCAVEVIIWGHGFGRWHADLTDAANHDRQAGRVAESIGRYREEHPGDPVFVVAKSGGAAVAVRALERLGVGDVERAVLLSPALSPRYDLTAALRGVRREIVVFWSPLDVVILGAGTWLFGTTDRVRTRGAGLVGFAVPAAAEPDADRARQYAKLRQIRWRRRMVGFGHLGGHFGADQPLFLREWVAPLLREGDVASPAATSRATGGTDSTAP